MGQRRDPNRPPRPPTNPDAIVNPDELRELAEWCLTEHQEPQDEDFSDQYAKDGLWAQFNLWDANDCVERYFKGEYLPHLQTRKAELERLLAEAVEVSEFAKFLTEPLNELLETVHREYCKVWEKGGRQISAPFLWEVVWPTFRDRIENEANSFDGWVRNKTAELEIVRSLNIAGSLRDFYLEQLKQAVKDLRQTWYNRIKDEAIQAEYRNKTPNTASNSQHQAHVFRKEGAGWLLIFNKKTALYERSYLGFEYLAVLLANPRRSFAVTELQSLSRAPLSEKQHPSVKQLLSDGSLSHVSHFGADSTYDNKTRRAITSRIEQLQEEIQSAEDPEQHLQREEELAELRRQLKSGTGIHGKARQLVSDEEKARWQVTRAIFRAFDKIQMKLPEAGEYLRVHIHTGSTLQYVPDHTAEHWEL